MIIPKIHRIEANGIQICSGFALATGFGVKEAEIIGLTTLLIALIPLSMAGVQSISMSKWTVSALGIRLNALSKENGQISLTATMPQSRTLTHLGAFFKTNLSISTARMSQFAAILMLMIFKKSSFIVIPLS